MKITIDKEPEYVPDCPTVTQYSMTIDDEPTSPDIIEVFIRLMLAMGYAMKSIVDALEIKAEEYGEPYVSESEGDDYEPKRCEICGTALDHCDYSPLYGSCWYHPHSECERSDSLVWENQPKSPKAEEDGRNDRDN